MVIISWYNSVFALTRNLRLVYFPFQQTQNRKLLQVPMYIHLITNWIRINQWLMYGGNEKYFISFLWTINANITIYYYIVVNHLPFSSRLLTSLILNLAAVTEMQKKQSSCYVTCFYVYIICFLYMFVMIVSCSKMYHGVREIYMTEKLFIFLCC